METILQDLERKSMEAEDLRGQVMPQWSLAPDLPNNTWRDTFNGTQEHVDRHLDGSSQEYSYRPTESTGALTTPEG